MQTNSGMKFQIINLDSHNFASQMEDIEKCRCRDGGMGAPESATEVRNTFVGCRGPLSGPGDR